MKQCKNCKWWGDEELDDTRDIVGGDGHKPCINPKVGGGSYADKSRRGSDALNSYDSVGTGGNFGCIHFEDK